MSRPFKGPAAGVVMACLLAACATPTERVERLAAEAGLVERVVAGSPFQHRVFVKPGNGTDRAFRVYLEGDGTPWSTRHRMASDPTPRQPLMLKLMMLDPGPALYLGRPCYFELKAGCGPEHWTSRRYSREVVESMAAALRNARRELGWRGEVTLLGHSGGGALAMLLARRVPRVRAVVTLAANLDIDAWARLHEYTPLEGSLNPAEAGPLPRRIRQIHLVGGRDDKVPPDVTRAGLDGQQNMEVIPFPEYDHHCCWADTWPSILERL